MTDSENGLNLNPEQVEILKSFNFLGLSALLPDVKNTLIKLMLSYIKSEEIEGDKEERDNVAFHIYLVNELLDDVSKFEAAGKAPVDQDPADDDPGFCKDCVRKEGVIEVLEKENKKLQERIEGLILGNTPVSDCKVVSF